jgi:3-hydroxy-9,10-secoandrosta-1,3,5(10)-triene-9,17-dione monooxygenase reductase component
MNNKTVQIDPKALRQALGAYTTGVTIITTRSANGEPVGITANSFSSVSLDPPLVLWSLARSAHSLAAFSQSSHWNVHVLSMEQEDLSNRFAKAGENKFAGIDLDVGISDSPLLPRCSARFQCKKAFEYDGGDHIIFVGEVLGFDRSERPSLAYSAGNYAIPTKKTNAKLSKSTAQHNSPYSEDLLGYLLGRAHYQMLARMKVIYTKYGINESDFFIIATLMIRSQLNLIELNKYLHYIGEVNKENLLKLSQLGLVQNINEMFSLTSEGVVAGREFVKAANEIETYLSENIGETDTIAMKSLLKRVILATDPGLPSLWDDSSNE